MKLALIGYGTVGKAFAGLVEAKHASFPFRIVAIHTARHGTAYRSEGLPGEPQFGPPAADIEEFLDRAQPEVVFEITTLEPSTGEPASSHIRTAFALQIPVVTANQA